MLEAYVDEYRPVTLTEHFLVAELAQAQCRLMRADARIYANGFKTPPEAGAWNFHSRPIQRRTPA